jgi:hypothetical protein
MAKKGKPNPEVESAVDRIRRLNERILDAAKSGGEESLHSYEHVLENLAEATEAAGERGADWIQEFARSQAKFLRRLAKVFPPSLTGSRKQTRDSGKKAKTKAREVPAVAHVEDEARGALSRGVDLPIPHYDDLTVLEINQQLRSLPEVELGRIDAYEARTKNRKTIRNRIETLRR